jgi:hypothetical protein
MRKKKFMKPRRQTYYFRMGPPEVFSFDGPSDLLRMMFPAWQATLLSLTIYFQLALVAGLLVGRRTNYIFSSKILKAEANKFDSDIAFAATSKGRINLFSSFLVRGIFQEWIFKASSL